ncbi:MAG: quinol:cytochrome C oxidoreductase [Flavobacteriales bacterium]|nr:quinol:cytochrome C oxidoreductase [Flavobacteriales bacterium]
MVVGLISLIAAYVGIDSQDDTNRFWANMLVNGLFFTFITLGALFFIALQYATEAAWSMMVRRIYESVLAFLPVGIIVLGIVFLMGTLHQHHIYHWMDASATTKYVMAETLGSAHPVYVDEYVEGAVENEHYDHLIAGKTAYLNTPFFWIRTLVYFATFMIFARFFRKQSLREDQEGGTGIHIKNYKRGALFLVFFAVFSSTLSWDWIMSIDTHWFSTMFGWYTFSGMWVSAMIVSVILVLYLKGKGLLPMVNSSHIHDMGKWVFAISFLWTYLWFSQFMLIWYSDIPEEVTYFQTRFENYGIPMFTMVFVNFLLPMVILMSRDAKRNVKFLVTVGTIIFFGHWFDTYLMVMPGVAFDHWHGLEWTEIGMMIGFLGAFIYLTLNRLSKAKLVPEQSPMLEESIQHHI